MRFVPLRSIAALGLGLVLGSTHAADILIDFDSLAAGSPVTTLQGVSFSASSPVVGPLELIVSDRFATTSGFNYLGVDDPLNFDVFFPLDVISLGFADPITDLTVSFISSPFTPGASFVLETPAGSATAAGLPDPILFDGGEVFTVSYSSATPFSSAELVSLQNDPFDIFSFNIDDIAFSTVGTVPASEPSSLTLMLLAVPLIWRIGLRARG